MPFEERRTSTRIRIIRLGARLFIEEGSSRTSFSRIAKELDIIRDNDTEKTRAVFGEFRPEWTDGKWIEAENLVSGIEYGTIMTREERTPLPLQIEGGLEAIMTLYGVPEEVRRRKIEKVLSMDFRALGRRILGEFKSYIEKTNEEALQRAKNRKGRNP